MEINKQITRSVYARSLFHLRGDYNAQMDSNKHENINFPDLTSHLHSIPHPISPHLTSSSFISRSHLTWYHPLSQHRQRSALTCRLWRGTSGKFRHLFVVTYFFSTWSTNVRSHSSRYFLQFTRLLKQISKVIVPRNQLYGCLFIVRN